MSKKQDLKKQMIKDIERVIKLYQRENPESDKIITRDYYREKGKFSEREVNKQFGSFISFKNNCEISRYENNKKIFLLEEENKKLKEENKTLFEKVITEDTILEIYKKNLSETFQYPTNCKVIKSEKNLWSVLNLCDVHLGEVVIAEEVNGVNEYNKKIAIQRLDKIFEEFKYRSKKYGSKNCCIFMNGDMFAGGIHDELIRNSDLNEVESLLYLQPYLIKKFVELSEIFNKIDIEVIVGNHGRILSGKPYYKKKTIMNYEYLLGMQLKMYFDLLRDNKKNNKININVPKSAFIVKDINNNKFLVTHGEIMASGSGGFAGIPFYSICQSASKLYGVLHQIGYTEDIRFDNIIMSHIHSTAKIPIFNGGICYIGGCVIGTNEYSLVKMRSVAKREQLMLIIDDIGDIISEINIKF